MPLFRRPDGDLVKDETPVRRIMPYLMRGRNESIIFHEQTYDIGKTRKFLRAFNQARGSERPVTLFQYFLWGCAQALAERPGLNRFVSGGRLYQRRGIYLSFAAKKQIEDEAPLVTVKLPFYKGEPFADCARRIVSAIEEGRHGPGRFVDKELELAAKLPGWLLALVMAGQRLLDRMNLLPGSIIERDPMYTSIFVANLGSVGLDRTYHHLYEYGTAAMFGVLGVARKETTLERDGRPVTRDVLEVRWSLDERVNDGMYCARGLAHFKKIVENPEEFAGQAAAGEARQAAQTATDGVRAVAATATPGVGPGTAAADITRRDIPPVG